MATKVRSKPYTLDALAGSVSSLEDLRDRAAQMLADADFMLDQLYKDLAGVSSDVATTSAASLGSVSVSPSGALSGAGTSGSPLAVKVDGSTVTISGDQLVAARQAMNVDSTKGLAGDGNATALSVKVDGSTVTFNGSGQLVGAPSGPSAAQVYARVSLGA